MIYRGQEGFHEIVEEAKKSIKLTDDYAESNSEYVTTTYVNQDYIYNVVKNVDLGVYYSVIKHKRIKNSPMRLLRGLMV